MNNSNALIINVAGAIWNFENCLWLEFNHEKESRMRRLLIE